MRGIRTAAIDIGLLIALFAAIGSPLPWWRAMLVGVVVELIHHFYSPFERAQ